MERPTIEREVHLPVSRGQVWSALTDGDQLSSWFGARVIGDVRAGGSATFLWPDGRERVATVEEVDPPHRLVFRWAPFERTHEGARVVPVNRVEFRLEEVEGGTLLRVTEHGPAASALSAGVLR
jgi:uncharacterized protein YndB with AHSA1/START domain